MSDGPWFRVNRELLVYKAFYFFFLGGFGSIFPYLPVYFRQIGLPASQVGLLLGLRPIVQFASAPFWAIMADKYRKRKSVLVMSVLSWLIMTMTLAFVEPTNEICEIRQGNDTHKHIVNYTKVKTGFFRRSLWHRAEIDSQTEERTPQQTDLEVVPIHIDHSRRRFKTALSSTKKLPASVAPKSSHFTQLQLGKSEIISQGKGTFRPRSTTYLSVAITAGEKQKDISSHEGNSSSITMLSSNREAINSKHNKQRERFYNKGRPKLKTRTNNTLETATGQGVSPFSEQIKSKHLSRFYKNSKLPGENNRRKSFSKLRVQKTHGHHQGRNNSTTPVGSTVEKHPENPGGNFTSKVASPAKHIETNDNSSIDKRRENKDSPPVVIEFSRIIIPHGLHGIDKNTAHSLNTKNENSSSDFYQSLVAENMGHKTFLHSNKPTIKQVNTNISKKFTQKSKQPTDNIDKDDLLQLKEKLSKIIAFDYQKTMIENSSLLTGKEEALKLRIGNTSPQNPISSNFSLTHSSILQKHVNNNTFYKEVDKLHEGKLYKLETKFVSHHDIKPTLDNSTEKETNSANNLEVKASNDEFDSDSYHSLSGSGSTLLDFSGEHNSIDRIYETPKEGIRTQATMEPANKSFVPNPDDVFGNLHESVMQGYEDANKSHLLGNESLLHDTDDNLSGNFQTSAIAEEETTESNFMQESQASNTHLVGNSDSKLQIWMTNLLKTNSFELKRIFTILLVLVVVGEFLEAPSSTLADASLLEHLGEERRYYGKQRLWGSLGFGLSSFFVGVLLERSSHVVCGDQYTDYMICFCVFALLMITTLFISTTFKFKYKETDAKQASVLWALCNIHYGSCLVAACFMGVGHGMSHSFLNWFLEDLGATKTLMGVAVISRSTLDLLTFFVAGSLIKAVGQIKIMICALISYGIAFTLYSLLTNPWWVLPIEMLVGCTYAASWSACTSYMAGAASSESVTTIQGILQGVYWGLGTGSGTIAGGFLIHHIGAVATFRCVACCLFVVCVLFCLAQMKWTHETTESHQLDFEYTYLPTVESKDTEELLRGFRESKASKNKHSATRSYEYR